MKRISICLLIMFLGISFQLNAQNKDSLNREFINAIKKFYFVAAKTMLEQGADVNAIDENKATAFMWACYKGNTDFVKFLVGKGADASRKGIILAEGGTSYGSPLIAAAGEDNLNIVKYLIEECKIAVDDPEIDSEGKPGWTALQTASFNGKIETVKYLVGKGADINSKFRDDGCTPLLYALQNNKIEVAKFLIENKSDVDIKNNLGWTALHYACLNNYTEIKNMLLKSCKDKSGLNWKQTWYGINLRGMNFNKTGNNDSALACFVKGEKLSEKEFGKKSKNHATSLDNLMHIYRVTGNYHKAVQNCLESLEIKKELYGEKSSDYSTNLNNLAMLELNMGNYQKAESFGKEVLRIIKLIYEKQHPIYAQGIENLGGIYSTMGNYKMAEKLYLEALALKKEYQGVKSSNYAFTLTNLSTLYSEMGDYQKAEPMLKEASIIFKKTKGEKDRNYIVTLNDLAVMYTEMGNYKKAEPIFLDALRLKKSVLGERHPDYAQALCNMGTFYEYMGNYQKAESLLTESLKLRKEVLGEKHPDYALGLKQLARLYHITNNYQKAEPLFLQAIKINKEVLGEKHPEYALSLNNLAVLYEDMSNYEKAEPLLLEALKINKEAYGQKQPKYTSSISNLATLYFHMKNFEKAEPLFIETLKTFKENMGTRHPDYAIYLNNLAKFYEAKGNFEKAEPLYAEANQLLIDQLGQGISFLSENEQSLFLNTISFKLESLNSFLIKRQKEKPSISGLSYNNELALKGALLSEGIQMRDRIKRSGDTALFRTYEELRNLRQQLIKLNTLPKDKRDTAYIAKLDETANELDKKLYNKSSEFRIFKDFGSLKWEDIQKNLLDNEAAIEFVNFENTSVVTLQKGTLYCGLLLRKDFKFPKLVYLFNENQLKEILNITGGKTNKLVISQLYNRQRTNIGEQMYNLIWKPLDTLLTGINTIYYAPSGLLNKISFSAISVSDNKYLSDKYILNQVMSTRQLALNKDKSNLKADYKAIIYGGIKYDLDSTQILQNALAYNTNKSEQANNPITRYSLLSDSTRGSRFVYLSSTLDEANNISSLLKARHIKTKEITGEKATEESFKNIGSNASPDIIHIATHGFFFQDPKIVKSEERREISENGTTNVYKLSENPLMRSGLAMAGVNRVWSGKEAIKNTEDGVLTAYEISNINLSNTKLAVLSACETGLGDIQGSEGVFGLQRAFKLAGVDYIIMSLWQVPDKETSEFMENFYTNWLSGKGIREAFSMTQQSMQEKYEPFKWAAFVLIE